MEEIKPCPFCGDYATASNLIVEGAVQCNRCKALIVRRHTPKKEDGMNMAIKAWNHRSNDKDNKGE